MAWWMKPLPHKYEDQQIESLAPIQELGRSSNHVKSWGFVGWAVVGEGGKRFTIVQF